MRSGSGSFRAPEECKSWGTGQQESRALGGETGRGAGGGGRGHSELPAESSRSAVHTAPPGMPAPSRVVPTGAWLAPSVVLCG